jgi:hypothetical protein
MLRAACFLAVCYLFSSIYFSLTTGCAPFACSIRSIRGAQLANTVRRMKLAQKNEEVVPQGVKDEIKGIDAGRPMCNGLYALAALRPCPCSSLPFLHEHAGTD